tara:strand:+ start:208 stop:1041 length:834 start_codon:yes stop_codon:yes gene_type:complete
MKVLSLFDGMSCARIALDRAAIPVTSYKASELDKYAIKVSHENYPDIEQLGDVCDVKAKDVGEVDLLIGGSPCQDLSFAGKGKGLKEGTRSSLFFEFVRLKNELNPKYFILENVRMKQENQDIISEYLGVKPKQFNSSLVSAQNRNRLFWTNIDFDLPDDKGIILADILENGITDRQKSHCLDANYFKGGNLKSYFEKRRRQLIFKEFLKDDWPLLDHAKSKYLSHLSFRKLTPLECERLQTVPDNYTNHVSNTQRYKMLGNGFTVDVVAHILKGLH